MFINVVAELAEYFGYHKKSGWNTNRESICKIQKSDHNTLVSFVKYFLLKDKKAVMNTLVCRVCTVRTLTELRNESLREDFTILSMATL